MACHSSRRDMGLFCYLRFEPLDHKRARGCIVMCVIFIMIAIFFPFRWGGEDLEC
jgi:hypothetical protein